MNKFGDWILAWNPTEPHKLWNVYGDLATLTAQMYPIVEFAVMLSKRKQPHDGPDDKYEYDEKCECDYCAAHRALAACKEFQEKYSK